MEQTGASSLSARAESRDCGAVNRKLGAAASRVIIQWFEQGAEIAAAPKSGDHATNYYLLYYIR